MSIDNLIQLLCLFITLSLSSVVANKIDSLQLYAYYNAKMHNTVNYEVVKPNAESDLVVRRGSNVFLATVLTEPLNPQVSQLYLRVMFGPNPNQQDGSMFFLPVQEGPGATNGSWSAHSAVAKEKKVDFKLYISPQAAVGGYRLSFMVIENGQIASEVPVPVSIYILFNPWSNADSVYMQDRTDIDEFVLNNFGVIYVGTVYNPEARQWYYEQFKKSAIQTAVYLLDSLNLSMQQRADPVIVSRSLSQMANSNDDNGVVFGKWTEPYEPEGKAPWNWMSSGEVLDNYVKNQGAPVKFGQCWVFAGITTTLSRSLGIPARTITAFASAHDTDNNLVVDRFFDIYGNEIKGVNGDSVWNFHVWTEVWMARPDLNGRYSNRGWQVIDATPQEKSDNIMRMGPANIAAAKLGDVNYQYDMPFLYSEVNADQISWVKDPQTQRFRKVNVVTNSIGQLILTKRKGQYEFQPLDLTLNYKFREGSQEERDSIFNAARIMGIKYVYDPSVALRKSKGDVNFEFTTENKQKIGENMIISYVLTNKASTKRTVDFKLNLKSIYYSGRDGEVLKKIEDKIVLGPKESRNFTVVVTPEEYLEKKVEFNQYKAIAFLRVEEKDVDFVDETVIALTKPELKIKITDNRRVGQPVTTNVSFKNPYRDQPLTNCKLISKETAISDKVEKDIDDIPAGGYMNIDLSSKAKKEGSGIILISLDCKELHDIRGHKVFNVNA